MLLTTAGMQPFKPYYTGGADALKDFGSLNVVSIQKSFRTSDIEEVGDDSHLTFLKCWVIFLLAINPASQSRPRAVRQS